MRLGVLVSGRGSNLGAVLDAAARGDLPGVEVVIVISNRPGVPALKIAERNGVPVVVLARRDFAGAEARDAAIGARLRLAGVDVALLAGYDQVLRPTYFAAFGRMTLNIHPSLLPAHGGAGMIGMAVHCSVLAAGDRETGVTVHEVSAELDAGPPRLQARVPVHPDDSPETLAARVLEVEHRVVVEAIATLAAERERGPSSATMAVAPESVPPDAAAHE